MQVCPFIVGRVEHADPDKIQEQLGEEIKVHVSSAYTVVSNPYWVIKKATTYALWEVKPGEILIIPRGIIYQTPPLHAETMGTAEWEAVTDILMKAKGGEHGATDR